MLSNIGRYRILAKLGSGGFGTVYLAEDPGLAGRRVAIKLLTATHDASLRIRFKHEAVAAASLHHANLVTIMEYGEEQEQPYIVMEHLEGQDLAQRIRTDPPLTIFQKVKILQQIAAGLHAAHSHPKKIVHRDVKPANVMLLPDGTAKIMDFGIARQGEGATRLTSASTVIGSAPYMAPEQFALGISDVQSDIWSFGVLAYELLTGKQPFEASDVSHVMYRVTTVEPPSLERLLFDCPAELSALIAKAMCKNRDERYHSLEDAILDLNAVRSVLRQSEATELLTRAERLRAADQLEDALHTVRDALSIDSQLTSARLLRDKLQSEMRRRENRSRLEAALRSVAEAWDRKDLKAAVSFMEQACALDATDEALARRLDELRQSSARRDQAEHAAGVGRHHLNLGDVSLAEQYLKRAEDLDPDAPGIAVLQKEMEDVRARNWALGTAQVLREAEAAYRQGGMDEAIRVLSAGLEKYPNDQALSQRLTRSREIANERWAELQQMLVSIQGHVDAGHLEDAAEACEIGLRKYPQNAELQQLSEQIKTAQARAAEHQVAERPATAPSIRPMDPPPPPARAVPVEPKLTPIVRQEPATGSAPKAAGRSNAKLYAAVALVAALTIAGYFVLRPDGEESTGIQITAAPDSLEFETSGQGAPPAKTVTVRPPRQYTIDAPAWMQADQSVSDGATVLTVNVLPGSIGGDGAQGRILIQGEGGASTSIEVRVRIMPPVDIQTDVIDQQQSKSDAKSQQQSKSEVDSRDLRGESLRAVPAQVDLGPGGARGSFQVTMQPYNGNADVTVRADVPWLQLERTSIRAPASVEFTASREQLSAGTHTGTIRISPVGTTAAVTVRIRIDVPARPLPDGEKQGPSVIPTTGKDQNSKAQRPQVTTDRWRGSLQGRLTIVRGMSPGETLDLTSATPGLTGSEDFPWLHDVRPSRIRVSVISPASLTVVAQPGPENDWNLIRIRAGTQAAPQAILSWALER